MNPNRIIVALDVNSEKEAMPLIEQLAPLGATFKIGLQAINTGLGHKLIPTITLLGGKIFWDIKLYDIPNTVYKASKAICELGVSMFNVHMSCQDDALRLAKIAATESGKDIIVLGVTVLTSFTEEDCRRIYNAPIDIQVSHFATEAKFNDLDGIICSPADLTTFKNGKHLLSLKKVTPGIRPNWAETNDQNKERTMTPSEAIANGADYLVIGRPISKPPKEIGTPADAFKAILKEISNTDNQERS